MFNKHNFLVFFFIVFILFSYKKVTDKSLFTSEDVVLAQKIFGINFSKEEIDTLTPYLKRNLESYKKMRKLSIDISTEPAAKFQIKQSGRLQNRKETNIVLEKTTLPKKDKDIAYLPVYKLGYLIKEKLLSSERLTKIYLNRIKKYNQSLNVIITLTEELAIKQAKTVDKELADGLYRGPLHGIPYGIKDLAS